MNNETQTLALAWELIYGEEYEVTPDPNKPENLHHLKAKKKQTVDGFKRLMRGPGKVLFEQWKERVRKTNLALLFLPKENLCGCPACDTIREVRGILELWIDAEQILMEDKGK